MKITGYTHSPEMALRMNGKKVYVSGDRLVIGENQKDTLFELKNNVIYADGLPVHFPRDMLSRATIGPQTETGQKISISDDNLDIRVDGFTFIACAVEGEDYDFVIGNMHYCNEMLEGFRIAPWAGYKKDLENQEEPNHEDYPRYSAEVSKDITTEWWYTPGAKYGDEIIPKTESESIYTLPSTSLENLAATTATFTPSVLSYISITSIPSKMHTDTSLAVTLSSAITSTETAAPVVSKLPSVSSDKSPHLNATVSTETKAGVLTQSTVVVATTSATHISPPSESSASADISISASASSTAGTELSSSGNMAGYSLSLVAAGVAAFLL